MQDGTEVPAKLLLKDSDLDLAYVLPIKERKKNTRASILKKFPKILKVSKHQVFLTKSFRWEKLGKPCTDNRHYDEAG